jgi:hypothetical protein
MMPAGAHRKGTGSEKIQNFYRSANTRKIILVMEEQFTSCLRDARR